MISDTLAAVFTVLLLMVGIVTHPTRGACPDGWFMPEVVSHEPFAGRPVGSYACQRPPIGGDDDVLTGLSTAIEQPGTVWSRIYCTGGTEPIRNGHRIVGCMRRPGS
jgi:hypothetical protein